MLIYNKTFTTEAEMRAFVCECDKEFTKQVKEVSDSICSFPKVHFILLSGPSCAGKTSVTQLLERFLEESGHNIVTVSVDDFYKNIADQVKIDGKYDFESINAIDFDCFSAVINGLTEKKPVLLPVFSFTDYKRIGYTPFTSDESTVVIIEGIQAMYPEICSLFSEGIVKKIFINVSSHIDAYGHLFDPLTLRFSRRLTRDCLYRASDAETTYLMWPDVRENEEKNIFPHSDKCDYLIDSFLPYEINVLYPFVKEFLSHLPSDSKYTTQAKELAQMYDGVPEIPSRCVPKDSFFREFIK